jgi:hypothetical protein
MLKCIALLGDVLLHLGVKFPLSSFRLSNLVTQMVYDISDLEGITGCLPYNEQRGIEITVEWMNERSK